MKLQFELQYLIKEYTAFLNDQYRSEGAAFKNSKHGENIKSCIYVLNHSVTALKKESKNNKHHLVENEKLNDIKADIVCTSIEYTLYIKAFCKKINSVKPSDDQIMTLCNNVRALNFIIASIEKINRAM